MIADLKQFIRSAAHRFGADRSGNVMMLFGVFGTLAFAAAGGAIDYGRWMQARYHTARALDAGVLAGARALQLKPSDSTAALAVAKSVYDSNVAGRLAVKLDTIQFVTDDNNMSVTASGQASMSTTLLGIVGITELPVAGTAGSKFPKAKITAGGSGSSNIEVAVMLDMTESMCDGGVGPCSGGTKIQGLKDAAKELVNIVVQSDQSTYKSRVGLVPFSTRIRLAPDGDGAAAMEAMTGLPATWSGYFSDCTNYTWVPGPSSESPGTWACNATSVAYKSNWKIMPCVTDRMYHPAVYDFTDNAPGDGRWLNAHGGDRMPLSWDSAGSDPGSNSGATSGDPSTNWNYDPDGTCQDVPVGNILTPLSSNKNQLLSRIDGLEAYGSTSGALGTAMAWYMLSPNWSGVWSSESQPGAYVDLTTLQSNGQPKLRKVAVIMTDGVYNTFRGWKGQSQQEVSNQAKQLCASMKAAGVEVYTVGFALDTLSAAERVIAEDTLKSCGTDLQHFYSSLTVDDLKVAFKEIALSLTTVFLSE